jgi:hypothetical protein
VGGRLDDGADEGKEPEGDGERSANIVGVRPMGVSGLGKQLGSERQQADGHWDIQEEDPAPTEGPGERATDQQRRGCSEAAHPGPAGQCLGAFGAVGEHRHQGGQCGWCHHRGGDSLQDAGNDEHLTRPGQPTEQR